MSILDAFEFMDFLDLILSWRFVLATAIGVGAGFAVYYGAGEAPAAAVVAFLLGAVGAITGLIWQHSHESGS